MQSVEDDSLVLPNNKAESLIESNVGRDALLQLNNEEQSLLLTNNEDQSLLQPNDDIESRRLCFTVASNLYSELKISDQDEKPVGASKCSYEASYDRFIQRYQHSLAYSQSRPLASNLNSSINVRFDLNPLRHRTPPDPISVIQRNQRRIARLDSVIYQVINRAQLRNQDTDR